MVIVNVSLFFDGLVLKGRSSKKFFSGFPKNWGKSFHFLTPIITENEIRFNIILLLEPYMLGQKQLLPKNLYLLPTYLSYVSVRIKIVEFRVRQNP